ncbi:hypothetical protein [Ruficoccus sp. ZRK36]|uniref:hypothetical protein n=1 Tax=Ruficoccus sp. ZRK36 TaxID=2866311 RepID=UPI001C737AA8|nr:hypothetical protein [Ruficoccus sp. ZRK36]QYY35053.1 hypothetical protein K0V07_12170 [Ruficoccus sp. ZRK36]
MKIKTLILLAMAAPLASILAHAQTVVSTWTYDFSGSASTGLDGQSTTSGSPELTWNSSSNIRADGSTNGGGAAWLPTEVVDGYIYTIKVDVDTSGMSTNSTSGYYAGLSFTTDNEVITQFSVDSPNYTVLAFRQYNTSDVLKPSTFYNCSDGDGNNFNNTTNIPQTVTAGTLTLTIDTTGDVWTYTASVGDTTISGSLASGSVNGVGLATNSAGAVFDNLEYTISTPIPEPASVTWLSLAGLFILIGLLKNKARN